MKDDNYLKPVRNQYEEMPYPQRDPDDEKKRLLDPTSSYFDLINFYCFRGKQRFGNFRVLAAGDGTGDATIFLAEQLRDKTASEVVYLDISKTSMKVAQERARIRGLDNIKWVHSSLLALPELDMGQFDFITCTGVLHHLESPDAGLCALKSVLNDHGAIAIMLYGQIGRTGLYQMQELMRMINADEQDMNIQVENTRAILGELPPTNWWSRGKDLMFDPETYGATSIYDMFLHSTDRAYTVPEMYEYIENCGLHFVDYPRRKLAYRPGSYIKNGETLAKIAKLDRRQQEGIAELIAGNIIMHNFFVSNQRGTIAELDDLGNVPYFFGPPADYQKVCQAIMQNPNVELKINLPGNFRLNIRPGRYTHLILKYLDGKRSLREIFASARQDLQAAAPSDQELLDDFRPVYQQLNSADSLLLRHQSVDRYKTPYEMQQPVTEKYASA